MTEMGVAGFVQVMLLKRFITSENQHLFSIKLV